MGTAIFSTTCYLMMNTIILFNFTKDANMQNWFVVDDSVMGGVSAGKMSVNEEGHGMFQGHVSLDNNGGFSSIRYNAGRTNLKGHSKFVIKLKGDGKAYQFRVKTNSSDYYSYTVSFNTTNQWQTIEIPFSSMTPNFRGQTLNMANFPGDSLEEIGFLIGNKKAEDFKLEIDYISVQ
jgi:NADH dehydrogenase [ubiquinone] 1 alpha subcomplex assembly factor 1